MRLKDALSITHPTSDFGRLTAPAAGFHSSAPNEAETSGDSCNCSRYESCEFCAITSGDDGDDDAHLDSYYRTLVGKDGAE